MIEPNLQEIIAGITFRRISVNQFERNLPGRVAFLQSRLQLAGCIRAERGDREHLFATALEHGLFSQALGHEIHQMASRPVVAADQALDHQIRQRELLHAQRDGPQIRTRFLRTIEMDRHLVPDFGNFPLRPIGKTTLFPGITTETLARRAVPQKGAGGFGKLRECPEKPPHIRF
jgi:hypothetical protein